MCTGINNSDNVKKKTYKYAHSTKVIVKYKLNICYCNSYLKFLNQSINDIMASLSRGN